MLFVGLIYLEEFLERYPDQSHVIICDIDWSTYLKSSAYVLHKSRRLGSLNDEAYLNKTSESQNVMTLELLSCLDPMHRRKTIEDFVRRLLSTWTETDCHEVDLNQPLFKYGVDSIGAANMSLQTRNTLGAIFEVSTKFLFLSHMTKYEPPFYILTDLLFYPTKNNWYVNNQ